MDEESSEWGSGPGLAENSLTHASCFAAIASFALSHKKTFRPERSGEPEPFVPWARPCPENKGFRVPREPVLGPAEGRTRGRPRNDG
jgi:hypothetical protein